MSEASEKRAHRDDEILKLFIAGATYRQIAKALDVGLATVNRAVNKQLAAGQKRRDLLSEEALAVHTERTERLFQAHWLKALGGDYRSADICRKILAQQARLHGLEADMAAALPPPTQHLGDDSESDEGPTDELSRIRAARSSA